MEKMAKFIKNSETIVKECDAFFKELKKHQLRYLEVAHSRAMSPEYVDAFYKCTQAQYDGEDLLSFLNDLIDNLYYLIYVIDNKIIKLKTNKLFLQEKWNVYTHLSAILKEKPKSILQIRYDMYNKVSTWEEYLENSTFQLFELVEDGKENFYSLTKNINEVLNSAFFIKKGDLRHSKISEIKVDILNLTKLRKQVENLIPIVEEKEIALTKLLKRAII